MPEADGANPVKRERVRDRPQVNLRLETSTKQAIERLRDWLLADIALSEDQEIQVQGQEFLSSLNFNEKDLSSESSFLSTILTNVVWDMHTTYRDEHERAFIFIDICNGVLDEDKLIELSKDRGVLPWDNLEGIGEFNAFSTFKMLKDKALKEYVQADEEGKNLQLIATMTGLIETMREEINGLKKDVKELKEK